MYNVSIFFFSISWNKSTKYIFFLLIEFYLRPSKNNSLINIWTGSNSCTYGGYKSPTYIHASPPKAQKTTSKCLNVKDHPWVNIRFIAD